MDLANGFQLKTPPKFVPWRIRDLELEDLFDGFALKKVKRGYYTLKCEPISGLHCFLGFHLHEFDVLTELEFFVLLTDEAKIKQSYEMFQRHFEAEFGKPSKTTSGTEGFPSHEWLVLGARIIHLVRERHGPEELLRITKR
jgi:hypothetical protein